MDFKHGLILKFANLEAEKLSRKTIKYLQSLTGNNLQSGDDSVLINVWDEFCVEVQYEESIVWDLYVETAKQFINGYVELFPMHVNQAIWLQTDEGFDWMLNNEGEELDFFGNTETITNYIFHEYLINAAGKWSNQRIRNYINYATYRD